MRIFSYEELDELGEGLIRQYLGKEAERTCCVDIEGFVTDFLKLPLLYRSFAEEDSDKIGFIADGVTPLRVYEGGTVVRRVYPGGTIVIERCLRREHESGRRRFTISHECAHYIMDRAVPSAAFHREFDIERIYSQEDFKNLFSFHETLIDRMGAALLIERPKKERFMANFYDADEVNRLFEISKGTKLEIPILFGAFYGMRRSETLGMKWDAIDFERDTITIRHTLTTVALDGKRITVAEDRTKNKSSMRTLPLVPFVKERLLELKAEQEENRRLCGRSYVKDYTGYVCINEIGDIIKPNYVSCGFPKLLEEHGLRRVRYHDLRHSCASLLLANGVPMKQIQEWLGHSDFSTTANIYAHLEYSSKVISADAMLAGLGIGNRE